MQVQLIFKRYKYITKKSDNIEIISIKLSYSNKYLGYYKKLSFSPMASLFRSLYGMPGLAPRMDVLS